jgi:hypothetical protein
VLLEEGEGFAESGGGGCEDAVQPELVSHAPDLLAALEVSYG